MLTLPLSHEDLVEMCKRFSNVPALSSAHPTAPTAAPAFAAAGVVLLHQFLPAEVPHARIEHEQPIPRHERAADGADQRAAPDSAEQHKQGSLEQGNFHSTVHCVRLYRVAAAVVVGGEEAAAAAKVVVVVPL